MDLNNNCFPERLLDYLNTTPLLSERMTRALTHVRFILSGYRLFGPGWPQETFFSPRLLEGPNVQSLRHMSNLSFPSPDVIPYVSPNLRLLSIDICIFARPGDVVFSHVIFQNLVTLEALASRDIWIPNGIDWSSLKLLKNLRHMILYANAPRTRSIVSPLQEHILPHIPGTLAVLVLDLEHNFYRDEKGVLVPSLKEDFRRLQDGEIHEKIVVATPSHHLQDYPEWVIDKDKDHDEMVSVWFMDVPESQTLWGRALAAIQLRNERKRAN
ncbi:hypothetical protein DL96DRAFT_1619781 [Flagelloscypha sp. PMI_526]|nr:hypothetical protein DL96DRAFT_1619781 [Flagelloscypha sp. PMI_526]